MTSLSKGRTLVLIEGNGPCQSSGALVVRWSSADVPCGEYALPRIVDETADKLRCEYLSWIGSLGEAPTPWGSLHRALRIKALNGISFWPLTLMAEKAPLRSPAIYRAFKLRALERLYLEHECLGVNYVGNDPALHATLRAWCKAVSHPYRYDKTADVATRAKTPWHERLPVWMQTLLFIAQILVRRRLAARGRLPAALSGDVAVVTYFPNIDTARAGRGEFRSRYWEGLHDLLEQQNLRTDWIWIYSRSQQLDYSASVRLRDEFDRGARGKNHHYLLHEFLTPAATIRALLGLAELYVKALRVSAAARRAFHFDASAMNLFPVLAEDWRASMYGKPAIDHLFYAAAFRELARRLRSTRVLYVWENQAWEKALIVACREESTAKTIGCQHATVPPLDVRSFPAGRGDVMPDILAVNGAAARDEMLKNGFPPERLRTVTALRYSHLAGLQGSQVRVLPPQKRTLLVVGGIMSTETGLQSDLLQAVTSALGRYGRCIVKPHTFCRFPLRESALSIAVALTERPLAELWHEADVVYCANSTSAAIEAAWLGLPLIVSGAGDGMNLSPLFNWPGMVFATDAKILAKQLEDPDRIELPPDYFCLDDGLASWNETLH